MKRIVLLGLAGLVPFGPGLAARTAASSGTIFTCRIGHRTAFVTMTSGRLVYHFRTAGKEEMTITGIPAAGNIFQMSQRYAGMEYQLRFTNGPYSYIVYSSEGNGNVGAAATSGLVVMRGSERISDRSCSRFANLTMPDDTFEIPEDTDIYSAM